HCLVAVEDQHAVEARIEPDPTEVRLDVAAIDLGDPVVVLFGGDHEREHRVDVPARRGTRGEAVGQLEVHGSVQPGQRAGSTGPGSAVVRSRWARTSSNDSHGTNGTPSAVAISTSTSFANATSAYRAANRSEIPSPTNATGPRARASNTTLILQVPQPTHSACARPYATAGPSPGPTHVFVTTGRSPTPAASRIGET